MKWLICGGRAFHDMKHFSEAMNRLTDELGKPTLVIHGDAPGADRLADVWARHNRIPCQPVPALWGKYGVAAGPIRNEEMIKLQPHLVAAFPGGKGTMHMIQLAESQGVPVVRV